MKKLPLSRQDFKELILDNCIYIDKTQYVYKLITQGFQYFFSRPRRFGKSLLLTTLREIFKGNREIFKGLWIYDKIEWVEHPVIEIYFNRLDYKIVGLGKALHNCLSAIADEYEIILESDSYAARFLELIKKLSHKNTKVAILIDEYDKPIIDYLDNIHQAEENREILRNFYSVIKGSEQYIRFLFITGVSKFSKVSIFSDLNHLTDITLDKNYATLAGITPVELKQYFDWYLQLLADDYKDIFTDIYKALEDEYLGYSWNGTDFVYNPYCLLNVLSTKSMQDFWYQSGTPTFLITLLKKKQYTAFDIKNVKITTNVLDKYDISNIDIVPLLFQTGYITIKKWDLRKRQLTMDFPNKEVERAFSVNLLTEFNGRQSSKTENLLANLTESLEENNIERFIALLKTLIKGIAYPNADSKENYFHSIFYLVLRLIGFNVESEILTIDGRIDCVIKTETHIYIVEFKMNTASAAIQQIREKQYHVKYLDDNRHIQLIGIAFDAEEKSIQEYQVETVK
jgi:hypothetical protein